MHDITYYIEIALIVTTLWFDKTDLYYGICKWEQITRDQPTNWECCPQKDPNKNNPHAAINSLTNQVNNFVCTSTKSGGATATTFNFSALPKSSEQKYHDHLNIEKLFRQAEMDKKLEDPNNAGHFNLLWHTGTTDSIVFHQFGILHTLSECN